MALGAATGDERSEQSIASVPKERVEDIEIPKKGLKGVKVITRIEDVRAWYTRLEGCLQLNDDLCAVVDRIWQGAYGEPCLIGGVQFLRIFEGKPILQAIVKPRWHRRTSQSAAERVCRIVSGTTRKVPTAYPWEPPSLPRRNLCLDQAMLYKPVLLIVGGPNYCEA